MPAMIMTMDCFRADAPGMFQCLQNPNDTHLAAFPMGLPEFDPVRLTIEGGEGLEVSKPHRVLSHPT